MQKYVIIISSLTLLALCDAQKSARCDFTIQGGDVAGVVTLVQDDPAANLVISGQLFIDSADAQPKHGFHIHQYGLLGNDCKDSGGHYNPEEKDHGAPTDPVRHVGDLGNIQHVGGEFNVDITDTVATLYDSESVVGRAMVLHAGKDDLGNGGDDGSITTGNAGSRMGCCLIVEN